MVEWDWVHHVVAFGIEGPLYWGGTLVDGWGYTICQGSPLHASEESAFWCRRKCAAVHQAHATIQPAAETESKCLNWQISECIVPSGCYRHWQKYAGQTTWSDHLMSLWTMGLRHQACSPEFQKGLMRSFLGIMTFTTVLDHPATNNWKGSAYPR